MERRRVLVAVSGGIAAYKVPELIRCLVRAGHTVRCVVTDAASHFVSPLVLQALCGSPVRSQLFDASEESEIDHVALADWADIVVLAPATANTLARLANGLADDLVSTTLLATRAPLLAAPAMNVNMWRHPATRENVGRLRDRGVRFIGPESGALACGWEGEGRMSEPETIAAEIELCLGPRSLTSTQVVVTAGGTREPIDSVRALTNRSSGKMGFAIAAEAARRGAETVLVAGPSALSTPQSVRRVDVETALEMREAVLAEMPTASVLVMAAAVADFRPSKPATTKIRKEDLGDSAPVIELVRNPDILAEICAQPRDGRIVVGFAAEDRDVLETARRKLARKGCDLLVANDVSRTDSGFDSDRNAVIFVRPGGEAEELPLLAKAEVAARLWDLIEKLRGSSA